LTVLEATAAVAIPGKQNRAAASTHFAIDVPVLSKLGELTGTKGGREARKFIGSQMEFTANERAWLMAVIPLLVRRAAQTAFDPAASRPMITMANLPHL
jgi:hypothetical protein